MRRSADKTTGKTTNPGKPVVKKPQNKEKDGARTEEPYNVHLNGSRAPPWPTAQATMANTYEYLLPKQLEVEDTVTITCETPNQPGILKFGLVAGSWSPEYNNIVCQLEMYFTDDRVKITAVQNGQPIDVYNNPQYEGASNYFSGGTDFSMGFRIRENRVNEDRLLIQVLVGEMEVSAVELFHDVKMIRFLTANGDINRVKGLNFQFGRD